MNFELNNLIPLALKTQPVEIGYGAFRYALSHPTVIKLGVSPKSSKT